MGDRLLVLESATLRVLACTAREVAAEAARRHGLAAGSAAALGQGMTGALLLAAHDGARVDVQLDCPGPVRGLLVDADADGAVRGLVRVGDLPAAPGRFDGRTAFASRFDEEAGRISILRAEPGSAEPQRAAFPFAGGDPGAALTFYLRNDRAAGGEVAIEAFVGGGVAGVLVAPLSEEYDVRPLGKPLRQGRLRGAMEKADDALALAEALFEGPLRVVREIAPHFACRCSKERVLRALRTLKAEELREMAEKDKGASITCDFCAEKYQLTAAELLSLK